MDETNHWYKTAVFYQIHIKCYQDSNGDGIGDFKGLAEKLAHIQNLGCNAIWLQPFYPSPLRDDGYDIADYMTIHKDYGTLRDFKAFLKEAHSRGLKVVTELVINHTSDQHGWFQRARKAPKGSNYRNYYIWEDTPEKYSDARIIFKDFETSNWAWDPVAESYYFHRFYSHQPDLNYDNPSVHKEIFKIADFWLDLGVDGMRLDAIPYLYKRDGTDCENLPETHTFLKTLRAHIDSKFKDRMLLAEANQWPEQACAYFGKGDECNMAFHFPVMPRLFMAIRMEDRFPIMDILDQTPEPPESCQWAMFLRNHDELTLEMVTDEERDYMWRVYAKDPRARINLGIRRRLAPLLENDRNKIELMNILLFSLPGSPVIYYGDEIGMGDNYYLGDRNGVRTPMQWNNDRNAGFSKCNPQKLYLPLIIDPQYHHNHLNVENQEHSVSSLLWWMRMAVSVRQRSKAFGLGRIAFLNPSNNKVLAFIREHKDEKILVVANLSRYSQYVELNLTDFAGYTPVDIFSQNEFSPLRNNLYGLTLGRYGYFWLKLVLKEAHNRPLDQKNLETFQLNTKWQEILKGAHLQKLLETVLPKHIPNCRWFRSKANIIKSIQLVDEIEMDKSSILLLQVSYQDDTSETYVLPVSFITEELSKELLTNHPESAIAYVKLKSVSGVLIDATFEPSFQCALFGAIRSRKKVKGAMGQLITNPSKLFKGASLSQIDASPSSRMLGADQTNSSLCVADRYFLKLYRRLEEGTNPDVELQSHLSDKSSFKSIPKYFGSIEWHHKSQNPATLAMLQEYIPNSQDVWGYAVDALGRFFDEILARQPQMNEWLDKTKKPDFLVEDSIPTEIGDAIGFFRETAELLGKRTAEMHIALIPDGDNKDMAIEPFTILYQKSLYQGMRTQAKKSLALLKSKMESLPEELKVLSKEIINSESKILSRYNYLQGKRISAGKIRIHGDLHLGQVLFTGKDYVFIDFEGEPQLPLGERRLKRSPLQDIAGMIRSFHYASLTALQRYKAVRKELKENLEPFADLWYRYVSRIYLNAYLQEMKAKSFDLVPKDEKEFRELLKTYILNKALYEVSYELQNRPDWVAVPVKGVNMLLKEQGND